MGEQLVFLAEFVTHLQQGEGGIQTSFQGHFTIPPGEMVRAEYFFFIAQAGYVQEQALAPPPEQHGQGKERKRNEGDDEQNLSQGLDQVP